MAIEVRKLQSKNELKQFIALPYRVYREQDKTYDAWVPPLDMDVKHAFDRERNGLYEHAEVQEFLAWDDGQVVGRIAAIVDRSFCEYQNTQTGFVGFFELLDRPEVAAALFAVAEEWLRQHGMKRVMGPVNGSTNNQIGNQIDSFDIPPVIDMPYSPPYYAAFYETAGYGKANDLYSYRMHTTLQLSDKISRVAELAKKRNNIEIRTVRMRQWKESLDIVRKIWDDAWSNNWSYVPWNQSEFDQLADGLKLAVDLDIALFAYIGEEAVGFAFPIPNLNNVFHTLNGRLSFFGICKLLIGKARATQMRIAAFGVKKAHQNKGVDALFVHELYERGTKKGYTAAEFSWILENNLDLRNLLENWGAEHYRTHRVYDKEL